MTTKRKPGRPKLDKAERRSVFIPPIRVLQAEADEIEAAIKASGMDKAEWLRKKLLAAARRA